MGTLVVASDTPFPVDARELYRELGITKDFSTWFKATVERLGLSAGDEWIGSPSRGNQSGGRGGDRRSIEYQLTQSAAKRIQADNRGEVGDAARAGLVALHEYVPTEDALILRAHEILAARVAKAEAQVLQLAPKAEVYDAIMSSEDLLTIAEVGNVVSRPGHPMGEIRLFRFLREQRILQHNNRPYQEHIDAKRFVVRETEWTSADGSVHVKCQTLVTQRGVDFIRRRIDAARGQRSLLPARPPSPSSSFA